MNFADTEAGSHCWQGIEEGISGFNCFLNGFQIILSLALVLPHLQFQRSLGLPIPRPFGNSAVFKLNYVLGFLFLALNSAFSDLLNQLLLIYHTFQLLQFSFHHPSLLTLLVSLCLKYPLTVVLEGFQWGSKHICVQFQPGEL